MRKTINQIMLLLLTFYLLGCGGDGILDDGNKKGNKIINENTPSSPTVNAPGTSGGLTTDTASKDISHSPKVGSGCAETGNKLPGCT